MMIIPAYYNVKKYFAIESIGNIDDRKDRKKGEHMWRPYSRAYSLFD
jgi:hypothetical protein